MITTLIISTSLLLGIIITDTFYMVSKARKLKEAECRLKDVEAERDAYEAASKEHLAKIDKLSAFKSNAVNVFPGSNLYAINHNKSIGVYRVARRFDAEEKSGCVAIKNFAYRKGDESDRLHALSEAYELLDALNDKVSWRISKDNGAIREDSRSSEEGETEQ